MTETLVATTPPVAPLPPGHRVGHFELQGLRGGAEGSDRVLYRAWDRVLARPVAVAEYLPQGLARRNGQGVLAPASSAAAPAYAAGLERFADDTRRLAGIEHPHLQRVLHLLRENGSAYAVMPWYHGQPLLTLRQRMAGPPDEAALRTLLEELLGALQAMHRAGQYHGSLNPAGVLMRDDDRALLLGPDPATPAAADFRAPECLDPGSAAEPGPWSDVYSLALLARFTVTGLLPAPGAGPDEPLAATVERLFFDQPQARFTPSLLRVLDLAAAAEPAQRPHSAEQFLAWLAQPPAARVAVPPPQTDETQVSRDTHETDDPGSTIDPAAAAAIQRLIDSIPPLRIDPPPGMEPAPSRLHPPGDLRAPPRRGLGAPRRRLAPWLLATAFGATVFAAWAMREPALQWLAERRAMPADGQSAPAAAAAPPSAGTGPGTEIAPVSGGSAAVDAGLADGAADDPIVERLPLPPPGLAGPDGAPAGAAADAGALAVAATRGTAPASATASPHAAADPLVPGPDTAAPAPPPAAAGRALRRATGARRAAMPSSPRAVCGDRTQFSLYRCMQRQCALAAWREHPQCLRLAREDRVD